MSSLHETPDSRTRILWNLPARKGGRFVLYWMTAARRTGWNYALDRAVELAESLRRPLVVLEALRVGYPWANDRIHRFILRGMRDNQAALARTNIRYYPYVEPLPGAGKGLLHALAESACAVVTDDSPGFFLPSMLASARLDVQVRFEAVDSNGLLPTRATERSFTRAYDFRRYLQRELTAHLLRPPRANSCSSKTLPKLVNIPSEIARRWPEATARILDASVEALSELPIDHSVGPAEFDGGALAGEQALRRFLSSRLEGYMEDRNRPEADVTSGLSAYLHFGQLSAHQVFRDLSAQENWTPERLGSELKGKREGWWGMSPSAEAFLDQLVTWRELGLNAATHQAGYDQFESLPNWAQLTLEEHANDERPYSYGLEAFENSATHDELWNAAQTQLRIQGVMPGYLRMLWGKKILHWSPSPRIAHGIMVELNDKYAIDGRDPNSHSGILWTLGKFDRAWGPERPIFGKVRYMTSDNTRRKLRVGDYIKRWG